MNVTFDSSNVTSEFAETFIADGKIVIPKEIILTDIFGKSPTGENVLRIKFWNSETRLTVANKRSYDLSLDIPPLGEKVAICFYGLQRSTIHCYKSAFKHIINPLKVFFKEVKIFVHALIKKTPYVNQRNFGEDERGGTSREPREIITTGFIGY